eukprot:GHUV01043106.1.p1 GENE.GHUV01043106.1~~GHUV01043106.1.p1  ORF type:complete len:196 (+),score=38.42 GHUV01043106.1:1303-1890(+)
MGAHLSTIHGAVQEQFRKQDEGSKGYLTLKEVTAVRTLYGINPCHIGVLYHVDRNHDGHFTLEEMQAFATFAQSYARAHRSFDSAYMTAGYTTLCMWRDLATVSGRDRFVTWAMKCFMAGYELVHLEDSNEQYIHRKALKVLHVLFDVEVGANFSKDPVRVWAVWTLTFATQLQPITALPKTIQQSMLLVTNTRC